MESTCFHLSLAPRKLFTQGLPILPFLPPQALSYLLPHFLFRCHFFSLGSHLPTLKMWPRVLFSPQIWARRIHAVSLPLCCGSLACSSSLARTQDWGLLQPLCTPSWLGAAFSCSPPNCPHLQQNSDLEPQQEGIYNWGLYTWVGWSWEYL